MKRLLVFSYFCPSAHERPGGVQQIVGPLLEGLADTAEWQVTVAHYSECHGGVAHRTVPNPGHPVHADQVDPGRLTAWTETVHNLSDDSEVVLSVDRLVPSSLAAPRVLMANTAAYLTEAAAILGSGWSSIITPTEAFATQVRTINPAVPVTTVPYGLAAKVFDQVTSLPPPDWTARPLVVRLPHRPDPRKGHIAAIEGLAKRPVSSPSMRLDITWLDEPRYEPFRQELEELASKRGISDEVTFRPWINGPDRSRLFADAHAILQLGEFEETFGLAAVEATLARRVAITARQTAVREVLAGSSYHVEIDDPLEWCRALAEVAKRLSGRANSLPKRRSKMPLAFDSMVAAYDAVLHHVIEEHS